MADTGDTPHHIEGNPSPSIFGGMHNEADLGKFAVPGNPGVGEMTGEKSVAELPRFNVRGNAST